MRLELDVVPIPGGLAHHTVVGDEHLYRQAGNAGDVGGRELLSPDGEQLPNREHARGGCFDVDLAGAVVRVDGVEAVARALVNDADLSWNRQCLTIHENGEMRVHV